MRRILLSIEYDGTDFCGWQKQKEGKRTVQGVIENALRTLTRYDMEIIGASRTDSGVHAKDQKAIFDLENSIPTEKLPIALNSILPNDVVIKSSVEVEENFNLHKSVVKKRYRYTIYDGDVAIAIGRNYSYGCKFKLNQILMHEAAKALIGEHDFSAFKSSGGTTKTSVREVYMCNVSRDGNYIYIDIEGNGFLYNMVRIIAGTLIDIGMGKKTVCDMKKILESKDRSLAGKTASPEGLCLEKIYFI